MDTSLFADDPILSTGRYRTDPTLTPLYYAKKANDLVPPLALGNVRVTDQSSHLTIPSYHKWVTIFHIVCYFVP